MKLAPPMKKEMTPLRRGTNGSSAGKLYVTDNDGVILPLVRPPLHQRFQVA